MANPERRLRAGKVRWYARYRDPAGIQRSKTFDRKLDADQFLTTVKASKLQGSYVDPKAAARTFREVAEEHWDSYKHTLAEDSTRPTKRARLDRHILPALGDRPIGSIKPSTVQGAVATWSQSLAPGTVGQTLRQVRQILDVALIDGVISSNPAKAVKAPKAPRRRDVHLSNDDVASIVAAAPEDYRALVVTLAGLGLRISEACGLKVADVDFLRKTVRVRQQRRPGGDLGELKTAASSRDIPAVDTLLRVLSEHIRLHGRADGLVFGTAAGKPLTKSVAGHVFDEIEETINGGTITVDMDADVAERWIWNGVRFATRTAAAKARRTKIAENSSTVDVSPHSLRHYFGSSLISGGTSVVAVSRWLGHSSPEITWRVYSYLMPSDDEIGRAAMTETMRKLVPDVYPMCTDRVAK